MTISAGGSAHNPTVITKSSVTRKPMRERIDDVIALCLEEMGVGANGGLFNANTLWPSSILDALGIEYGPGSELATRLNDEQE